MLTGEQYAPNLIKKYHYWDLFLSPKQRYLGRMYAWWQDRTPGQGENMAFDEIHDEALIELKTIWRDVVRCARMLGYKTDPYGPDFKLNTSYLSNEKQHHNGHMHVHFYPRTSENFMSPPIGVMTMDEDFEKPPISGGDRELTEEQMVTLRRLCGLYAIGGI